MFHMQDDPTFEKVDAKSWTPHPSFRTDVAENDIGMIRLIRAVPIEPVALSFDSGFPEKGDNVIIIGFGFITEEGPISDELLRIDVEVGIDQECNNTFGNIRDEFQFCAGGAGEVSRC
jgi:hypothetical protein